MIKVLSFLSNENCFVSHSRGPCGPHGARRPRFEHHWHRWISSIINNNTIKGELSKPLISEVCIKLVALRTNRYPRRTRQFQMVGDPWLRSYAQVGPWLLDKTDFLLAGKVIDENVKAPHKCELGITRHVITNKYLEWMLLLLNSDYGSLKKALKLNHFLGKDRALRHIKCISSLYSRISF